MIEGGTRVSMVLVAGIGAPGRARAIARRRLTGVVSGTDLEDVLLILSEMIVLRLADCRDGEHLDVTLAAIDGRLRIEVLGCGDIAVNNVHLELVRTLSNRTGRGHDDPPSLWAEVSLA